MLIQVVLCALHWQGKKKRGGKGEVWWKINRVQHLDFWSLKRSFRTLSQWGFVLSFISCKFSSPLRRTIYRTIYTLTLPKLMVALLLFPLLSTPKTSSYLVHTWPNKIPSLRHPVETKREIQPLLHTNWMTMMYGEEKQKKSVFR